MSDALSKFNLMLDVYRAQFWALPSLTCIYQISPKRVGVSPEPCWLKGGLVGIDEGETYPTG